VLRALDRVVALRAIGDEEAESVQPLRSGHGAREDDHEVAVAGTDELLAAGERPAAATLDRLRRDPADIGASLRLGHRDRADDLAAREPRDVPLLLLLGAVPDDHRRRCGVERELDHRARTRAGEHLDDERRQGERQTHPAVLARERETDEAELREALEIRLERLAHLDMAAFADHPELVHLARA